MSDSHDHHDHHGEHAPIKPNKFMERVASITGLFDGPATLFRGLVTKFRKDYPYYHRNFPRVPTIDQCGVDDHVCIQEANDQFFRDRKVDKFITQILEDRVRECYMNEGPYDGFLKCRAVEDDFENALTNYFIKYGDLGVNATAADAYMKQKHRLIWQRRNPDKDLVGIEAKQKEIRKEIADYQKRATSNPTHIG